MTKSTDQIRNLTNRVQLAGILAELGEVREGENKDGIPYISFNGRIQCGESAVSTVPFRTFVKSKKNDGTDSKVYANIKKWVAEAVPLTKAENPKSATKVDMLGSLVDNPYVSSQGQLVEGLSYNMQLFSDFNGYKANIDLEGFISAVSDEVQNEEPTGRQKVRFISMDIFRNALDLKNLIIPEDLVKPFEEGEYGKGRTAKFYITLLPNEDTTPVVGGGFGVRRTEGRSKLEMVITGGDPPIPEESELALDPKVIKKAMTERKSHLDEVLEAGYLGNSSGSSTSASRSGFGSSASTKGATKGPSKAASNDYEDVSDENDDDDFPF